MIHRYKLGSDLELHKRTLQQGLLSLIGPDARAVAGAEDLPQAEHRNARGEVDGIPVLFVATDVGVDLVVDAERTDALAEALRARGARDVGEDAAEALRVERGRPRFGRDMDDSTIPQEAGINQRAVSFTKGCYVGQETVARLHYRGKPNRHLRGLAPLRAGAARHRAAPGRQGGRPARHRRAGERALAIVRREAEPGATLRVGEGDDDRGGRRAAVRRRA